MHAPLNTDEPIHTTRQFTPRANSHELLNAHPTRLFLRSSCAECLKFEKGPYEKNCSIQCANVTLQTTPLNKKPCKERDSEGCWIEYTIQLKDGWGIYSIHVEDSRGEAEWSLGTRALDLGWVEHSNKAG